MRLTVLLTLAALLASAGEWEGRRAATAAAAAQQLRRQLLHLSYQLRASLSTCHLAHPPPLSCSRRLTAQLVPVHLPIHTLNQRHALRLPLHHRPRQPADRVCAAICGLHGERPFT